MINRHLDDRLEVLIAVLAPNIARVDSILREKFGSLWVRREELVTVVVEVTNDRRSKAIIRQSLHDLGDRCRGCVVVDGNANNLTSGACKMRYLCCGASCVSSVSVRH